MAVGSFTSYVCTFHSLNEVKSTGARVNEVTAQDAFPRHITFSAQDQSQTHAYRQTSFPGSKRLFLRIWWPVGSISCIKDVISTGAYPGVWSVSDPTSVKGVSHSSCRGKYFLHEGSDQYRFESFPCAGLRDHQRDTHLRSVRHKAS